MAKVSGASCCGTECPRLIWRPLLTGVSSEAQKSRTRERLRKGESYDVYVRRTRQKQKHNDRRSSGGNRCDHLPLRSGPFARNLRRHIHPSFQQRPPQLAAPRQQPGARDVVHGEYIITWPARRLTARWTHVVDMRGGIYCGLLIRPLVPNVAPPVKSPVYL
jgi:hypothetical protein